MNINHTRHTFASAHEFAAGNVYDDTNQLGVHTESSVTEPELSQHGLVLRAKSGFSGRSGAVDSFIFNIVLSTDDSTDSNDTSDSNCSQFDMYDDNRMDDVFNP